MKSPNTTVIFNSNNTNVASVFGNKITAHAVGKTTITVTTNNGNHTDSMIVEVIENDTPDPNAKQGYLKGTLVDGDNNQLYGYTITLYSNPITTLTDNSGEFVYGSIPFETHTIVVNDSKGLEVGRFALNISKSNNSSMLIDNQRNIANISYSNHTRGIELIFQTDRSFSDIDIIDNIIVDRDSTTIVNNPKTGYNDHAKYLVFTVLIFAYFIAVLCIRRKGI